MPKRHKNNKERGRGGGHTSSSRGRGRGGGSRDDISTSIIIPVAVPATQPQPRSRYAHTNEDIDVVIQQWAEPTHANGNGNGNGNGNRKRGTRWGGMPKSRSGVGTPSRGAENPQRGNRTPRWGDGRSGPGPDFRGRGQGTGRGRGRGRGRGIGGAGSRGPGTQDIVLIDEDFVGSARRGRGKASASANYINARRLGKDAPLSNLLYAERPLLRPVLFVRPTMTSSFLFQQPEDVLEPTSHVADVDTTEESHVPTADRVAQLFHDNESNSDSASDDDGGLEEVDFADLAQVRAEVDAIAHGQATTTTKQGAAQTRRNREGIEEIDFADLASIRAEVDAAAALALEVPRDDDAIPEETFTGIYNQVKEATQAQNSMNLDVDVDDQPDDGVFPSTSGPTADEAIESRPSIDISNTTSIHVSRSALQDLDTILVEEEAPLSDAPHVPHTQSEPLPEPRSESPLPLFFVDTEPTRRFTTRSTSDVILVDRAGHGDTLGDQYDDEERIVYVAPHPRTSRASLTAAVPRVKLPETSMLTGTSTAAGEDQGLYKGEEEANAMPAQAGLEEGDKTNLGPTVSTSTAASSSRQTEVRPLRWSQRQRQKKSNRFGALGAMVSEARLREADAKERRHPLWETRRKGDSDIDWGTEDDEGQDRGADVAEDAEEGEGDDDEMDVVSNGLGGMSIDPDLDLDSNAMQGFLESMSAEGSQFVTMDDLEDELRMRRADEEGQGGGPEGSSGSEISDDDEDDEEEEEAFNEEEVMLIAESESDKELSDDSDEDLTPRANFQARLQKMRERSHSQRPESVRHQSDDDDDEDDAPELEILPGTRSADDESFMADINRMLEENSHILSDRNQRQKKGKAKATSHREGGAETFVDDPEFTTPVAEKNKKKKTKTKTKNGDYEGAYFAAELEAQWVRDREKKAERRRERREEMLRDALDPLYLTPRHKGGGLGASQKKKKNAMRAAARLDPSEARAIAPQTLLGVDASTEEGVAALESYVRAFAFGASANNHGWRNGNGNGKSSESVAFPPMDKEARTVVHALAQAFGLKSVSKGMGMWRYTTLIRTTRAVDEGRVKGVMKRFTGGGKGKGKGKGDSGGGGGLKHREGEVVGKEAPKIGEGNVGFRMLASMGWTKGKRIGSAGSVGIDDPLTAKIKHTKLGLGAR